MLGQTYALASGGQLIAIGAVGITCAQLEADVWETFCTELTNAPPSSTVGLAGQLSDIIDDALAGVVVTDVDQAACIAGILAVIL